MKLELASDFKTITRWWSVRISAIAGLLSAVGSATAATGAVVPWFGILPRWEVTALISVVFWSVLIARIIKQQPAKDKTDGTP